MKVSREFKCCSGCCWCAGACSHCAFEITIEAPVGNVIGYVKQKGSFWKANYDILDENQETILKVEGPCCICDGACCTSDIEFKVSSFGYSPPLFKKIIKRIFFYQLLTSDKSSQIGSVKKVYAGFVTEMFTMADRFTINCKYNDII